MEHKDKLSPSRILDLASSFWKTSVIYAALRFALFTKLSGQIKMSPRQIKDLLQLNCLDRQLLDFLDALTDLGLLRREGPLGEVLYSNSDEAEQFLDANKPCYVGGILELYRLGLDIWKGLDQSLSTGQSQIVQTKDSNVTEEMQKESPAKARSFANAMTGIQYNTFHDMAKKFDFSKYKRVVDLGGSAATFSVVMAQSYPHLHFITMDLPVVEALARENVCKHGLEGRIKVVNGDFFKDELPEGDLMMMGNILHMWDEERKKALIKKVYDGLPAGGAFVVIEHMINNERKGCEQAFFQSLNMLVGLGSGFNFSLNEFKGWAEPVGFKEFQLIELDGFSAAIVAIK